MGLFLYCHAEFRVNLDSWIIEILCFIRPFGATFKRCCTLVSSVKLCAIIYNVSLRSSGHRLVIFSLCAFLDLNHILCCRSFPRVTGFTASDNVVLCFSNWLMYAVLPIIFLVILFLTRSHKEDCRIKRDRDAVLYFIMKIANVTAT